MYGVVNYGIKKMITDASGEDTWEKIYNESGVGDVFSKAENYPDEYTGQLAMAACKVLDMDLPSVLHAYGKWWIGFAQEDYATLFAKAGSSFREFLGNMNDTHRRVGYMFPESIAPAFVIVDETEDAFTLQYYSKRQGFAPFVVGLVEGLGEAFATDVKVQTLDDTSQSDGFEAFHIVYRV